MPVIQSLSDIECKNQLSGHVNFNQSIGQVTFEILKEKPVLVADVANDVVDRSVLIKEIIKVIDAVGTLINTSREEFIENVLAYMFGYGPLQGYIEDDEISDIDGTKYNEFCIVKNGIPKKIKIDFGSEEEFNRYCHLIAIRNYGILNENDSHCRVCDDKYRLRINVSIRPRNITGPSINIRKHKIESYTINDLVELDMLDQQTANFLINCVQRKLNVVFGGHGGSGKTTLLRALVNCKPEMERVLICESDSEIFPDKPFCICQRIKRSNEGGRIYTLADLVKDGLTMRIDTYVIGESVSNEAWEGIKAAHSGHSFLTTTHAMSGRECLDRLAILSSAGSVNEQKSVIYDIVGKSIDIIVYMKAFKLMEVIEVVKFDATSCEFVFNCLFKRQTINETILEQNKCNFRVKEKLS